MQLQKNSSIGKAKPGIKLLIKIIVLLFVLFLLVLLVDKIDFPSPNKKIEITVPNENFKVVK
jgi:hypothetical protein